jgi:hypothetical protein
MHFTKPRTIYLVGQWILKKQYFLMRDFPMRVESIMEEEVRLEQDLFQLVEAQQELALCLLACLVTEYDRT